MSQRNEYPSLGTPPSGSIRFNTDSAKMEIYNGEQWWDIDATSPEQETGGTRGVLYLRCNSWCMFQMHRVIQFIQI